MCSETCALDLIGATYVRDVEPGEMVVVGADGLRSLKPFPPAQLSHCIFEHVYFARPDSEVFGQSVNEVRTELGRRARPRDSRTRRRDRPGARLRRVRGDRYAEETGCRCASASSATTTWAARSSSPRSRSGTSASR